MLIEKSQIPGPNYDVNVRILVHLSLKNYRYPPLQRTGLKSRRGLNAAAANFNSMLIPIVRFYSGPSANVL